MTLFSLAWRNIKRNLYDYFLYFISMVFSIMIYFTFTSIKYNEQALQLGQEKARIAAAFSASSVILAIFALIFIWYSNSFFIRKRKKEVALYSLLGIKKREIGRMLFYENIVMGLFALLIGIFMGGVLSKLFIMLLVRLMGFSTPVEFTIIPMAIIDTLKVFTILFLITSIHGYAIIYRYKLVELFKADRTAEKAPRGSIIIAILSLFFIIGGYYFYLHSKIDFLYLILITLISVVIGTFLFFSAVIVLLIKLARKNKKSYYRGINMIGITNLLYRFKSHARTLATIAVLSATTLTAMSATASLYYDFTTKLDLMAPFSYVFLVDDREVYQKVDSEVSGIIASNPEHRAINALNFSALKVKASLPSGIEGNYNEQNVYLLAESEYNIFAKKMGLAPVSLNNPQETFFIDEYYNGVFKESYTGKDIKIENKQQLMNFKVVDFDLAFLNRGFLNRTLVVENGIFKQLSRRHPINYGKAINVSREKSSGELTKELASIFTANRSPGHSWEIRYRSFYDYYFLGIVNFGVSIFIGAFLGLVFLISTGSIIFFKLLSEAEEEKMRYKIIRNIGVARQEVKALLRRQILFIFSLPLVVGIIHSLVATSILQRLLNTNITVPITITTIIYTLIYMVYYLLTIKSYHKIIS